MCILIVARQIIGYKINVTELDGEFLSSSVETEADDEHWNSVTRESTWSAIYININNRRLWILNDIPKPVIWPVPVRSVLIAERRQIFLENTRCFVRTAFSVIRWPSSLLCSLWSLDQMSRCLTTLPPITVTLAREFSRRRRVPCIYLPSHACLLLFRSRYITKISRIPVLQIAKRLCANHPVTFEVPLFSKFPRISQF